MQRKRRKFNGKDFPDSPGSSSNLHGISTVRMKTFAYSIVAFFLVGSAICDFSEYSYALDPDVSDDGEVSLLSTTAGISVSGAGTAQQITVAPGAVGYREHTVTVNATDVSAYTLKISGPTNLTGPSGATAVGGANNALGSSMTDNTWGYGWGDTGTTKESLRYQTLNTNGTNLDVPAVSNNSVKMSKKLVFAVKFASNNTYYGQYKANVTLSLVATPATTAKVAQVIDRNDDNSKNSTTIAGTNAEGEANVAAL